MKYANLVLSLASMSWAAACGSLTLTSQLDIDTQASCSTVNGDVKISSEYVGTLNLAGVETVTGAVNGAGLHSLSSINFPDLKLVAGSINLTGSFNDLSIPSLENVNGGFKVISTKNITCATWTKMEDYKRIRGKYECRALAPQESMH
ncbi:uncharacterized protein ATNIH1004_010904 [Aspergillus tanneri]|uniref:Receptor L-domain domain-containing protein n=1 Tax=Aspergillus tanneri TaxID=1220188 RepID=A0A5M9M4N7_9EURO|nr:uncharacterized protein ATNIH1004_010904 [Aspergillus tanneri]KAA8641965.1 hypothetical protein ATNIH1004_010904 [Aspergillus tanneri]